MSDLRIPCCLPNARHLVLSCCLLLTACGQPPPTDGQPPRTYSAAAFFETTTYRLPGGYAWSADGQRLLIGADTLGALNAYALPLSGAPATALTASADNAHRPLSWFPSDDRILYAADNQGDELDHVHVLAPDGQAIDLTPGEGVKALFMGWSQADDAFHVATNERDAAVFDLYRYAADGYARELLFENDANWRLGAVSPNGRYLALVRENSSADNDIHILDREAADASPVHITPHEGNVSHAVHGFTPDSGALLYGSNQGREFMAVWRWDAATGEQAPLIQADWDLVFAFHSRSGRYLVQGVNEDARIVVRIKDTATGDWLALPGLPEGNPGQIRFSRDESKVALLLSTDTSPNDVYVVDLAAGESRRLTQAPNPEIDEADLAPSAVVRYPSFDGLEIPAILYRPKVASAANPAPALVWVHGGPGGQSRRGYSATIQHLVNHGYAILAANNRGSSGYGKTFFHMDDRRHGEVDLDDIVYGKRYLAGLDWVDGERIGIIGGSYGGYMVGAALAFRPGVFKVGINIFGVMNWVRTLESIPPWWGANRKALFDELGDPAVDGERLRRISPLFHAENIKTPLLVIQGANDPRVLQVESDEIVAAVRANGTPVEYLVFPDEGHGFSRRENRIAASEAFVGFLGKHLR
ncbi:MAG: S9 family peptidase [Gammaproteobacteria bacterium]|nr:S9 family peptidase [Gammaproteobacteria bacterium]